MPKGAIEIHVGIDLSSLRCRRALRQPYYSSRPAIAHRLLLENLVSDFVDAVWEVIGHQPRPPVVLNIAGTEYRVIFKNCIKDYFEAEYAVNNIMDKVPGSLAAYF